MQSILKLYLTRIGMVASVIVASLVIGIFPIDVRNGSAVTLFSVGLPTLALTVWARPGPVRGTGLVRDLFSFVVPAVFLAAAVGVLLFYAVVFIEAGFPEPQAGQTLAQLEHQIAAVTPLARTSLTGFLVFCGLSLFACVVPATQDRRPLLMACALGLLFLIVIVTPLRELFALQPIRPIEVLAVVIALAVWLILLLATWHWRLLDRYLALPESPEGL
jgi:cation-transporting ATPase E